MIRLRPLAAVVAAVTALGGCALLSTPDPVQTYRFGGMGPAATAAPIDQPTAVILRRVEFPNASRGDRILGVTGVEAAYIAGARWVSPAQTLFQEGLEQAFATQASRVRLIGPREMTPGARSLDIDVRTFETRYAYAGAAPEVVISAHARLLALPDRTVVAERTFTVTQPAGANRVSSIVDAYETAVRDLNTQLVGWTDQNAG